MSSRSVFAVAAMATTLAAVQPAAATNDGVSEKRARAIVKQEVAKIQRVRGPAGPRGPMGAPGPAGPNGDTGPAGMDGFPSLFARVVFGEVDASRSVGITQENVLTQETQVPDDQGGTVVSTTYCFIGLPPIMGGQVTTDGNEGSGAVVSPKLQMNPFDQGCPIRVSLQGSNQFAAVADSFYILLY